MEIDEISDHHDEPCLVFDVAAAFIELPANEIDLLRS